MSYHKDILKSKYGNVITSIKTLVISLPITFMSLFMSGCVDDMIEIEDSKSQELPSLPVYEGDAIAFTVNLDRDLTTRSNGADAYDNYIDTNHKFKVLFFTENGDFLFAATDRTVTELPSGNSCNWYVRVPVNYLEDRNKREYPVEKIKAYLKSNKFKIAILANWPNQDADGEEEATHPEPNWNVENSYFYEKTANNDPNPSLKNINDLHHLFNDSYYSYYLEKGKNSGRPSRLEVYDFLMNNGKAGINTDWVKMRDINEPGAWKLTSAQPVGTFNDKESAEQWIRDNWNPQVAKSGAIYRDYKDMWYLWDFNASYNSTTGRNPSYPYNTWGNNKFGEQWYSRNGSLINDWITEHYYTTWVGIYPTQVDKPIDKEKTIDGLTFVPSVNDQCHFYKNGSNMGLLMKKTEKTATSNGKEYVHPTANEPTKGYLTFEAKATGTYRIKCSSTSGTAKLCVQLSTNPDKTFDITGSTLQDIYVDDAATSKREYFRDKSLTGGPEPVYIWTSTGNLVIYSIEWICAKYLYDTDREGVIPSEQNPIPMYGVQEFQIPENAWEDGSTYDVSATEEGEEPLYISLIRSLAKVVINLTQKPEHIYMRSMNRMSRVEPMDVESSTGSLWKNHDTKECEWFDIFNYGVGFESGNDPSEADREKDLDKYTNYLSWFYGTWQNAKWYKPDPGNDSYSPWNFYEHNVYSYQNRNITIPDSPSYPHLFNPDIERSDYCHFIPDGKSDDGQYFRYILYVPDKNISDPNYPGLMNSIAKLPSIEYRYSGMSPYLDDNNCHRVYFTDYETNTAIKEVKADQYETVYEKSKDNLNKHWPIMRNHEYRFNVGGSGTMRQTFQVKVADWGYQPVDVVW